MTCGYYEAIVKDIIFENDTLSLSTRHAIHHWCPNHRGNNTFQRTPGNTNRERERKKKGAGGAQSVPNLECHTRKTDGWIASLYSLNHPPSKRFSLFLSLKRASSVSWQEGWKCWETGKSNEKFIFLNSMQLNWKFIVAGYSSSLRLLSQVNGHPCCSRRSLSLSLVSSSCCFATRSKWRPLSCNWFRRFGRKPATISHFSSLCTWAGSCQLFGVLVEWDFFPFFPFLKTIRFF